MDRSFYPASCSASCYRTHAASICTVWQASSSIVSSCIQPIYWKKEGKMVVYLIYIYTLCNYPLALGVIRITYLFWHSIRFLICPLQKLWFIMYLPSDPETTMEPQEPLHHGPHGLLLSLTQPKVGQGSAWLQTQTRKQRCDTEKIGNKYHLFT